MFFFNKKSARPEQIEFPAAICEDRWAGNVKQNRLNRKYKPQKSKEPGQFCPGFVFALFSTK